jgi:hypothetical protein
VRIPAGRRHRGPPDVRDPGPGASAPR